MDLADGSATEGCTLLVASGGGHLTEILTLRPRIATGTLGLVTYEGAWTPETATDISLLAAARSPTTKNLGNAIRNYGLARKVLGSRRINRVVSTGAAVAVPFMLRAAQLGIPCHYIESATRVDGPSLTGRILERVRDLHLYRQLGEWGGSRWQKGPCVFDGFTIAEGTGRRLSRVLVSLGTHGYAFPSLIDRLAGLLLDSNIEVTWQLGSTPPPPSIPGHVAVTLPIEDLQRAIAEADLVIGHAGVGLTSTCLKAGKVPVLVPRRRARREHTDDHQSQLARELERQGLAVVAEVGELDREHLERAAGLVATYDEPPPFQLID